MSFLHEGYPRKLLKSKKPPHIKTKSTYIKIKNYKNALLKLLASPNITSKEFYKFSIRPRSSRHFYY